MANTLPPGNSSAGPISDTRTFALVAGSKMFAITRFCGVPRAETQVSEAGRYRSAGFAVGLVGEGFVSTVSTLPSGRSVQVSSLVTPSLDSLLVVPNAFPASTQAPFAGFQIADCAVSREPSRTRPSARPLLATSPLI